MNGNGFNWHEFMINNSKWCVPTRYSGLEELGNGGCGQVCSAYDCVSKQKVAIKKLPQPFATEVHAKRAFREIKLLKHVEHENIIRLFDIFTEADSPDKMENIYLVTNLMSTDLRKILKKQKSNEIKLTDDQIRFLIYEILRALKYIHSSNIIHRDLKPENLTVNEDCDLRIIDFGLARCERDVMTGYVATRWYRAPEVILKWMHYSKAVDIWSVGCILAELYLVNPLFPGTDHVNQLDRIMDVVGYPSEDVLNEMNEEARNYLIRTRRRPKRVDFFEYFKEIPNPNDKILQLDPNNRLTVEEAIKHPYLLSLHDESDEPFGKHFEDSFETFNYNVSNWKQLIFDEIRSFVPPDDYINI